MGVPRRVSSGARRRRRAAPRGPADCLYHGAADDRCRFFSLPGSISRDPRGAGRRLGHDRDADRSPRVPVPALRLATARIVSRPRRTERQREVDVPRRAGLSGRPAAGRPGAGRLRRRGARRPAPRRRPAASDVDAARRGVRAGRGGAGTRRPRRWSGERAGPRLPLRNRGAGVRTTMHRRRVPVAETGRARRSRTRAGRVPGPAGSARTHRRRAGETRAGALAESVLPGTRFRAGVLPCRDHRVVESVSGSRAAGRARRPARRRRPLSGRRAVPPDADRRRAPHRALERRAAASRSARGIGRLPARRFEPAARRAGGRAAEPRALRRLAAARPRGAARRRSHHGDDPPGGRTSSPDPSIRACEVGAEPMWARCWRAESWDTNNVDAGMSPGGGAGSRYSGRCGSSSQ